MLKIFRPLLLFRRSFPLFDSHVSPFLRFCQTAVQKEPSDGFACQKDNDASLGAPCQCPSCDAKLTLQLLASLRAAADSGAGESEHRSNLLSHLETASLGFLAPKSGSFVMTGPDGFPYFPFYIPPASKAPPSLAATTASTVDMVGQHSVSRYSTRLRHLRDKLWTSGCGVALYYTQGDVKAALEHTTLKGQLPAYVLTHGELLDYHLSGTLQLPEQMGEESSAVKPELQVGRGLFLQYKHTY